MRPLNGPVSDCVARLRSGVDDVQATRSARTAQRRRETERKRRPPTVPSKAQVHPASAFHLRQFARNIAANHSRTPKACALRSIKRAIACFGNARPQPVPQRGRFTACVTTHPDESQDSMIDEVFFCRVRASATGDRRTAHRRCAPQARWLLHTNLHGSHHVVLVPIRRHCLTVKVINTCVITL